MSSVSRGGAGDAGEPRARAEAWMRAVQREHVDLGGPVRVRRTVDTVVDRLTTAIALGDFTTGERLPVERDLAQLLGVGRTTLRKALARLRELGLVDIRRGRGGGTFVRTDWTSTSPRSVRRVLLPEAPYRPSLSDLRCLIEATIARTAAVRRTESDAEAISLALHRFERATQPSEARSSDADLHRAVTAAAANPYLFELSRQLLASVTTGLPIEPYSDAGYRRALPEHRALATAVIEGRPYDAERIALAHFRITVDEIDSALRRGRRADEDRRPPDS